MKCCYRFGMANAALLGLASMGVLIAAPALAQDEPSKSENADPSAVGQQAESLPPEQSAAADRRNLELDPATYTPPPPPATPEELAAGNFTAEATGENSFHIATSGTVFTTREDVELYLAYRAARLAIDNRLPQFIFVENRQPGDTMPEVTSDPVLRFSFRLENFLPTWSYVDQTGQEAVWRAYSGSPFPAEELAEATSYTVSADIQIAPGPVTGTNPLAFEAFALSDYLINQVAPPQ